MSSRNCINNSQDESLLKTWLHKRRFTCQYLENSSASKPTQKPYTWKVQVHSNSSIHCIVVSTHLEISQRNRWRIASKKFHWRFYLQRTISLAKIWFPRIFIQRREEEKRESKINFPLEFLNYPINFVGHFFANHQREDFNLISTQKTSFMHRLNMWLICVEWMGCHASCESESSKFKLFRIQLTILAISSATTHPSQTMSSIE